MGGKSGTTVLYPCNRDIIRDTYNVGTLFLTNNVVPLFVLSPVPSSATQQLGTSHISLKTEQVASSLDV